MKRATLMLAALALLFGGEGWAKASIIQTIGAGTAVTTVDREATFDTVQTGTNLNGYTEDHLLISVNDIAFTNFDPTGGSGLGGFSGGFHYPAAGAAGGTLITTTDNAEISGIEFNVGSGYGSPTTYFAYEAFKNGVSDGSGAFAVESGSVLGFSDPSGFNELYIGAYDSLAQAQSANVLTDFQAVAIDNVKVQLQPQVSASPEPASLTLAAFGGVSLLGYAGLRRRRKVATA